MNHFDHLAGKARRERIDDHYMKKENGNENTNAFSRCLSLIGKIDTLYEWAG